MEWSDGPRSGFFYNLAVDLLTSDTLDCSNPIMDRPISTCWDLGDVQKPNVRQGKSHLNCPPQDRDPSFLTFFVP